MRGHAWALPCIIESRLCWRFATMNAPGLISLPAWESGRQGRFLQAGIEAISSPLRAWLTRPLTAGGAADEMALKILHLVVRAAARTAVAPHVELDCGGGGGQQRRWALTWLRDQLPPRARARPATTQLHLS
jgi:hypothetical protein